MIRIGTYLLCAGLVCWSAGCSKQTQQEASEALEATGEAVSSAADDAAENTEKITKEVSDSLKGNESDPDAVDHSE